MDGNLPKKNGEKIKKKWAKICKLDKNTPRIEYKRQKIK